MAFIIDWVNIGDVFAGEKRFPTLLYYDQRSHSLLKFVNLVIRGDKFVMETASINHVLELFNRLSKSDQLKLADKIEKQTFKDRWQTLDEMLPDIEISDEDIMSEVRAVRYGDKKN